MEQEISFDFGPSGEFAYLYSQCYELATNEYILALGGLGVREEGAGEAAGKQEVIAYICDSIAGGLRQEGLKLSLGSFPSASLNWA